MKGRRKKNARTEGRKEEKSIPDIVLSERKGECYGTSLLIRSGPPPGNVVTPKVAGGVQASKQEGFSRTMLVVAKYSGEQRSTPGVEV